MNWKKIKEQYPAAWEAFCKWIENNVAAGFYNDDVSIDADGNLMYCEHRSEFGVFEPRLCFDFFDEKGIIADILYECYGGGWFAWTLVDKNDLRLAEIECDQNTTGYLPKSRTEAEAAAFERAFSILNNQLLGE